MLNTNAPKMTMSRVRRDTGSPENGVMTVNMPIRISMLGRDMGTVYQGDTMTTNSPRTEERCAAKCSDNSVGVPEMTSS